MTVDDLRTFGAGVDEGLARCLNNEEFYLNMVNMAISDDGLEKLGKQLAEKDYENAFETAHALKGVYANLELTPIKDPVSEITELLRDRKDMDYTPLYEKAKDKMAELKAMG